MATRQVSRHRVVPDADQGGDPGLSEALTASSGQFPGLGELEGLRRAVGGLPRPRDAGDHTVAPLRAESAPVRGFGGCAPVRPMLWQRRGSRGFEGGRSIPSPEPSVRTLGTLAHDQVGLPALALLWSYQPPRTARMLITDSNLGLDSARLEPLAVRYRPTIGTGPVVEGEAAPAESRDVFASLPLTRITL